MLYLLRSYTKDGSMLKAGYADNYKNRYLQYESHNPGIEEVSKRDGDLIDETLIHLYLHFLGYNVYKDEWYKDCKEVIDIFSTPILKIENLVWDNRDAIFSSSLIDKNITYVKIYDILRGKFGIKEETNIDAYRKMRDEKKEQKRKRSELMLRDESELNNAEKFLKSFLVLKTFPEKMKFLCESEFSSDAEIEWALDQVPLQYKNYYEALGLDRLKACGYNVTKVKKEYESEKVDVNLGADKIYATFHVGGKYSKSEVKAALGEIYNEVGYNKTPKATDLDDYFVIGNCRLPNSETGKRDAGIEIIKKRD